MIYFDNSATTPIGKAVAGAVCRTMTEKWGNPSAAHGKGREAELELDAARRAVRESFGVKRQSDGMLIFTGSGTEADNLAITGTLYSKNFRFIPKIVTTDSEHPAVARSVDEAEKKGFEVVRLSTRRGVINFEELASALDERVVLVSVMRVNNETGAVYPVKEIFGEARKKSPYAVTHTDAVQGYMKINCNPDFLNADLVSVSGHKIGGPKGIGALWARQELIRSKRLAPIIFGGGQENGMRSGTENMPGIVGMAAAASLFPAHGSERVTELRNIIVSGLPEGVACNTCDGDYLPNIISLLCRGIKSEVLVRFLSERGIYVSAGSACSAKRLKTSPALTAFGLSPDEADSTIRVSISADNTEEECRMFLSELEDAVKALQKKRGQAVKNGGF
ncbi:MAG: cysteine desulfurase [Clostridia bacterium]|nr:cysteine desulfurase [Clostridia bacterium]